MIVLALIAAWLAPQQPADPAAERLLRQFRDEFVLLKPGQKEFPASFAMGGTDPSCQPVRRVTFQADFAICRYETTQQLYEAVMGANPSRWKGPRNSVEMVSHDEAVEFCRRATAMMRKLGLIEPQQTLRLPSEAEWEYAARAGTATRYSFGDDAGDLDQYAWHTGNAAGNDPPVGAKKPNPWGLYDMHGYLWEWCADHGHADYRSAPSDGSAWTSAGDASQRVIRGGSWKDPAASLESACRRGEFRSSRGPVRFVGGVDKGLRDDAVGFRCVLSQ